LPSLTIVKPIRSVTPEAEIVAESFWGLNKSYTAVYDEANHGITKAAASPGAASADGQSSQSTAMAHVPDLRR